MPGKGHGPGALDRLLLTPERIEGIVTGMVQVMDLEDPIGQVLSMKKRPNGLLIGQKRVPLGVVGIIYEARPNVTADAFALCLRAGNAVILRGGSDAINSNRVMVSCIRDGLKKCGIPEDSVQLITDTSRETATGFMRLNGYLDVLIPRGGAGLIRSVVENSTVPVIETGTGNCHVYVDESADLDMALDIVFNAKTQRIGVCNACESLLVHRDAAERFLPRLKKNWGKTGGDPGRRGLPGRESRNLRRLRRRTGERNTWIISFPVRSWILWTRPSAISTATTPATQRPL